MDQSSKEPEEIFFQLNRSTTISYDRNDIIGWGAFSFNYKGKMSLNKTSEDIAIKEIKVRSTLDSFETVSIEAATNEIQIHGNLKHKNILKFLGYHKFSNGQLVLVQKLCNQGDLSSFMKKHQFMSQEGVLHFFFQMLEGFKYLIGSKIFHGDIKPENILLHNDKVKIADFGMSIKLKTLAQTFKDPIGSPSFMSPEILNGETYNIESDVWSLGVTLYYMIYEQLPWGEIKNPIKLSKYLQELFDRKLDIVTFPEKWRFPVSQELKTLIKRMLTYKASGRITWNELFKSRSILLENCKMMKKGIMPLLYKTIDNRGVNKAVENFCSPMLLIDSSEVNLINKIKVWEFTNAKSCKAGN